MKVIELLLDYKGSDTWVTILDLKDNIILDGDCIRLIKEYRELLELLSVKEWDLIQVFDVESYLNVIILEIIINEHISK